MKKQNLRRVGVIVFIMVVVIFLIVTSFYKESKISNFEECVEEGNSVMESYPRQCIHEGEVFTELIEGVEDWKQDGIILMQNSETGEYTCFGCGKTRCIDPILIMKPVEETSERHCDEDFEVINGETFVEIINKDISSEMADYFYDKFIDKAIDLSGGLIPIEGFTPRMYTDLFSELKKEDFNNVEAIGGVWKYSNNQLIFINSNANFFTSADGTINKIGMKSLLGNLKQRFNIQLEDMSDIDNLLTFLSKEPVQNFCPPESRNVGACIEIYQPVCGWNDPEKIQCIKYPCASTYSNSCFACSDENVLYYTKEVCPE